jgi:hypothetical protein
MHPAVAFNPPAGAFRPRAPMRTIPAQAPGERGPHRYSDDPGHRGIGVGRGASAAASARRIPSPARCSSRLPLTRWTGATPAAPTRWPWKGCRSGSCRSASSPGGKTRSFSSLPWQRRRCMAGQSLICSMRSPGGRLTTSGSTPCTRRSLISAPPPAGSACRCARYATNWPRPGRIFAAARSHSFRQLAGAIDDAFARWDRSHLQEFTLTGQTRLCRPDPDREIDGQITEDDQRVKLSRLRPGEQFVYVFDLGDDWARLCTAGTQPIDPVEVPGIVPDQPLPYWGWGDIPDQYRRRWHGDDGQSPQPPDPGLADLPPLRPHWGPAG